LFTVSKIHLWENARRGPLRTERYVVFLATTRRGYESFTTLNADADLWIAGGILTAEELKQLRARGFKIADFTHQISSNEPDEIADAVSSIREHHPGESIWVEA
jgi:hypothetical protein